MPPERPLGIGLLGATGIAVRAMVEPARRVDGVQIRAVAARDPARAAAYAGTHGIPVAHAGYREMLADPAVDVVYVSLHNAAHARWAVAAAGAGKHVIVEKPLCLDAAEVADIRAAATAGGVHVIEAVMTAGHPWQRRARELVASDELGDLVELRTRLGFDGGDEAGYRFDPGLGGGVLRDTAPYWLQAVDAVVGLGGAEASARCERAGPGGVDLETTARLCWPRRRGGAVAPVARLHATFRQGAAAHHELVFTGGRVKVANVLLPAAAPMPLNLVVRPADGRRRVEQLPACHYYDHQLAWIREEITSGRPGRALDEAASRVLLMDAALRSARAA